MRTSCGLCVNLIQLQCSDTTVTVHTVSQPLHPAIGNATSQQYTVPRDPSTPATGAHPTRVCDPAGHREPQQAAARAILSLILTLTGFHIYPWTVTCEVYAKKQKFPLGKNVQAAGASLSTTVPQPSVFTSSRSDSCSLAGQCGSNAELCLSCPKGPGQLTLH